MAHGEAEEVGTVAYAEHVHEKNALSMDRAGLSNLLLLLLRSQLYLRGSPFSGEIFAYVTVFVVVVVVVVLFVCLFVCCFLCFVVVVV